MVKTARPMELREIADALDLPAGWFTAPAAQWAATPSTDALGLLEQALGDLGLARGPSQGGAPGVEPGTGRPGEAAGGAGA